MGIEVTEKLGRKPLVGATRRAASLVGKRGKLPDEYETSDRVHAGPREDKYLKILQNLQAKGAVAGDNRMRSKLMEGTDRLGLRQSPAKALKTLQLHPSYQNCRSHFLLLPRLGETVVCWHRILTATKKTY